MIGLNERRYWDCGTSGGGLAVSQWTQSTELNLRDQGRGQDIRSVGLELAEKVPPITAEIHVVFDDPDKFVFQRQGERHEQNIDKAPVNPAVFQHAPHSPRHNFLRRSRGKTAIRFGKVAPVDDVAQVQQTFRLLLQAAKVRFDLWFVTRGHKNCACPARAIGLERETYRS